MFSQSNKFGRAFKKVKWFTSSSNHLYTLWSPVYWPIDPSSVQVSVREFAHGPWMQDIQAWVWNMDVCISSIYTSTQTDKDNNDKFLFFFFIIYKSVIRVQATAEKKHSQMDNYTDTVMSFLLICMWILQTSTWSQPIYIPTTEREVKGIVHQKAGLTCLILSFQQEFVAKQIQIKSRIT